MRTFVIIESPVTMRRTHQGISMLNAMNRPLLVSIATTAVFLVFGKGWLADLSSAAWFALMLGWLFGAILVSAFAVGAPCGRSGHSTRRTFLGRWLHACRLRGPTLSSIAPIILGLNVTDMVLLLLTLVVSMLTFALERTQRSPGGCAFATISRVSDTPLRKVRCAPRSKELSFITDIADHRLLAVTVHHDYGEPNVVQPTVYVTIIERVTPPFYVPSRS